MMNEIKLEDEFENSMLKDEIKLEDEFSWASEKNYVRIGENFSVNKPYDIMHEVESPGIVKQIKENMCKLVRIEPAVEESTPNIIKIENEDGNRVIEHFVVENGAVWIKEEYIKCDSVNIKEENSFDENENMECSFRVINPENNFETHRQSERDETRCILPRNFKRNENTFMSTFSKTKNHLPEVISVKKHEVQGNMIKLKSKTFKCQLCDYGSEVESHLKQHIDLVHLTLKTLECHSCDYTCSERSSLKKHLESVHLLKKTFKCHFCHYKCYLRDTLKQHLWSIHMNVKNNNQCPFCSYVSSEKWTLKKHIDSVHLKLEDYECNFCDYSSDQKYVLKVHIDSVHFQSIHECHICSFSSTRKTDLKKHIENVHFKLRPHKCHFCKISYVRKYTLNNHIKLYHKNQFIKSVEGSTKRKNDVDLKSISISSVNH